MWHSQLIVTPPLKHLFSPQVTSEVLCNAISDSLAPYFGEEGCIQLIQCFLNPKLMVCHVEFSNPLQKNTPESGDGHHTLERRGKTTDLLYQLFVPGETQQIGLWFSLHLSTHYLDLHIRKCMVILFLGSDSSLTLDQSEIDLRYSLANLVGVVLGCPSNSNHLWYNLFHPELLFETYMPGFMVGNTII